MSQNSKKLILLCLLTLMLVGIQAIKESPWHDHSRHIAECGLCHLQFSDDSVVAAEGIFTTFITRSIFHTSVKSLFASARFSPYQGRAPPAFL